MSGSDTHSEIAAPDLLALIEAGTAPAIIDVRSRREFHQGHVPGARLLPFWKAMSGTLKIAASSDDLLVVYCGHGPRARLAGAALRRRGFHRVAYLKGHMSHWRRSGLPEERT